MRFVDTNVLIYALDSGPEDEPKRNKAREILQKGDLGISVQVLQEFYTQAIKPKRRGRLSHEDAIRYIEGFYDLPLQPMTVQIFQAALFTKERYQISYWDAEILEAARALGCDMVLSEDLGQGQDYGGVRVVNPFLDC